VIGLHQRAFFAVWLVAPRWAVGRGLLINRTTPIHCNLNCLAIRFKSY